LQEKEKKFDLEENIFFNYPWYMKKFLFFGYGANSDRQKIKQIIGRDPGEGVGAILDNYVLAVQELSLIPEPPRNLLAQIYGNSFKAYTLKKGQGVVSGVLWELNDDELAIFKKWEFVGVWREIIEVEVKSAGQKPVSVLTEKSMDQFPVAQVADGVTYEPFNFKEIEKNNKSPKEDPHYTKQQIEMIKNWLAAQAAVETPNHFFDKSPKVDNNVRVKEFDILKK
jgi:hypothetical protein